MRHGLMDRFVATGQRRKVMLASGWKPIVLAEEVMADQGDCPHCAIAFMCCDCPCDDMEGYDYRTVDGITYARPRCNA